VQSLLAFLLIRKNIFYLLLRCRSQAILSWAASLKICVVFMARTEGGIFMNCWPRELGLISVTSLFNGLINPS